MKLDPYFTQYNKINAKWTTEPNVGAKAIKLDQQSQKVTHRLGEDIFVD